MALALLLTGCTDEEPPITAPHGAPRPSQHQVSEDGVIRATIDLPFAPGAGGDWWMWGRFPEHEVLRIPAGPHEVEFEVGGGVYFVRKPGVEPWQASALDGVYIGPGGVRLSQDEWFPALRLQMAYEHASFEGLGYPPLYAWQAEPYSTGPARGRIVLTGPGRIIFNRHYNSGWFGLLDAWTYEGKMWQYYDYFSDQKVKLTIRPQARIKLDCGSETVTRGDSIGCSVSAEPSGTLTDVQWRFTDSAGVTVAAPNGTGERWGGRMVAGGEISVSANLDGDSVGESRRIAVKARNWPN